jgi:diguanylate cyclase (GGDEF)-like protein
MLKPFAHVEKIVKSNMLKLSQIRRPSFALILVVSLVMLSFAVRAQPVAIPSFEEGALGKYTHYFQEKNGRLSLAQAQQHFSVSSTKKGSSNSISLGLGVDPVWMKFTINNTSSFEAKYRLSIETPWLDYIDTWLVVDGKITRQIKGGDGYPFEERPMPYRFYAFEHPFSPGVTEIYIRVEAEGPMALPVKFSSIERAIERDIVSSYQYGVLYGIMFALALYNLVLFVFIRQKEYGLYSLYLIGFILNSLSYTGQLFTIITYDFGVHFQDWVDIFLMITYSVAGLHFARVLLATKEYAPGLDRFVCRTTLFIPLGMLVGLAVNQLFFSLLLAFILNTCFVVLFVAMGIRALMARKPFAIIFIVSSVTAAICITVSTLAVAGFLVPYNDYTFKAIELGMAFEAILLAVILARQFRMAQLDKMIAETYARTDSLTQLNNRRGFQELVKPILQNITREKRDISIALIDIDFFKKFNDQYGHDIGDNVLKEVSQCIAGTCRKGDVSARWGGEEFIVFLPETSQNQALLQAERIRVAIEQLDVTVINVPLSITVSIGIAGTKNSMFNYEPIDTLVLEPMINQADRALYVAKQNGKNQVQTSS